MPLGYAGISLGMSRLYWDAVEVGRDVAGRHWEILGCTGMPLGDAGILLGNAGISLGQSMVHWDTFEVDGDVAGRHWEILGCARRYWGAAGMHWDCTGMPLGDTGILLGYAGNEKAPLGFL